MEVEQLIVLTEPEGLEEVERAGAVPGHLTYRMVKGPRLAGAGLTPKVSGGVMVFAGGGISGGDGRSFCRQVAGECRRRNFHGVVADLEGEPTRFLGELLGMLEGVLRPLGAELYVPEDYGPWAPHSLVMIPSALSGGSLEVRLEEAVARWGGERVVLALRRSAEDFLLPAVRGEGRPLEREELKEDLARRRPGVFFSPELCARYYTYLDGVGRPHFVLFDDGETLGKKVRLARSLGVKGFLLPRQEMGDTLPRLRGEEPRGKSGKNSQKIPLK